MGPIRESPPGKLVMGITFGDRQLWLQIRERLVERFGPLDVESPPFPFQETTYYTREMGPNLQKCYLSFRQPIPLGRLPEIKCYTNTLERETTQEAGGRRINVDPGYLTADKVVLATTKNFSHRPYLGQGIYAELTYRYRQRSFQPLEWTYPDYRCPQRIAIFNQIRQQYLR